MITRRVFLAGAGSALLLVSCGDDASTDSGTTGASSGERALGGGFANGLSTPSVLVAGIAQRLPLVVFDADTGTPMRENGPASIDVSVLQGATVLTTATVTRHDTGIPTPYYPLTFTPPAAGAYEVRAEFSKAAVPFKVETRDTVKLVQVGDPLRPVATPTTANARGVTPICTRTPSACPFHAITLTDAIAAKKPTVLIISTPGFCQTAICGPVLELLIELAAAKPALQVVHAEVYVDPNKKGNAAPQTTETVTTYGLQYEPSLLVADAGGIVRARLDFSWDRTELEAALATVA